MKFLNKKLILSITAIGSLIVLNACGSSGNTCELEVSIFPESISLSPGQKQLFNATEVETCDSAKEFSKTANSDRNAFEWTTNGGSFAPAPFSDFFYQYTAPSTPGTYIVSVTSLADGSTTAIAEIVVE